MAFNGYENTTLFFSDFGVIALLVTLLNELLLFLKKILKKLS